MSIEKRKISSYLIHNMVRLSKMTGKQTLFRDRWVEYELNTKYWEDSDFEKKLLLIWIMLHKVSGHNIF